MKTITPRELHTVLTSQPETTVVDVRTAGEFESVHILGARNLPLNSLDTQLISEIGRISQAQPVYLVCHSGTRARLAAEQFNGDGIENTVVVEGGAQAWQDAGLPIKRGEIATISLERQVRIAAGTIVLVGVQLNWLVHPWFIGLSAFVGVGLVFSGISGRCGMGRMLAKFPWNSRIAAN